MRGQASGSAALVLLVLCLASVAACSRAQPDSAVGSSPQGPPPSGAASIESAVRDHYGPLLESVHVEAAWLPDSSGDPTSRWPHGKWVYRGAYRLKGVALEFPFTVNSLSKGIGTGAMDGAYNDRVLIHDEIGGVRRFCLLAKRYHQDFPTQPTMAYWSAKDNGVSKQEPYVSLLKGHRGPSVVVYQFDDYWIDGSAPSLGLYAWNAARHDWVLVHRGSLPDLR